MGALMGVDRQTPIATGEGGLKTGVKGWEDGGLLEGDCAGWAANCQRQRVSMQCVYKSAIRPRSSGSSGSACKRYKKGCVGNFSNVLFSCVVAYPRVWSNPALPPSRAGWQRAPGPSHYCRQLCFPVRSSVVYLVPGSQTSSQPDFEDPCSRPTVSLPLALCHGVGNRGLELS